ncbi:hypothetical protein HH214_06630 [Mucilaginibacter robiniae]|uniref:Uncharacterized protein n=1 Tax=Mucilaginibacter robiniae TaxID=2728022 RepID=A0A7L5DXT0_9SPHI|nr:hypothetical protein [Mucilaginibacter robiniae]QJD95571.1 hypothetical protein HH214_06630 [Mucilaginibacter robiniae]
MKRYFLLVAVILFTVTVHAQKKAVFPFQGGKDAMMQFFKNNVEISPELAAKKVNGTAVFKFTADAQGAIEKIIVYYADDYQVTLPFIDALKKSDHHWIIFDGEKTHDFIVACSINPVLPSTGTPAAQKQIYQYYSHRQPIVASNEVLLDMATLLPAVTISYPVSQ